MFLFDLLPNEILLHILKYVDFKIDVESLISAIGINDNTKKLFHVCNHNCLKSCGSKPVNLVTPLRFVHLILGGESNIEEPLINHGPALKCDFLSLTTCKDTTYEPFEFDRLIYERVSDGKSKIVLQNQNFCEFLFKNIHFKDSSLLQLENKNGTFNSYLTIRNCTVDRSLQKFNLKGLRVLMLFKLSKSLLDHLNLDEYPLNFLLLFTYPDPTLNVQQLPKSIHLNDWNNQTLIVARLVGIRFLENVNLPNVRELYVSFHNYIGQEDSRRTIINNLNVPNLMTLKLEIEEGCPELISNVNIGTIIPELSILYLPTRNDSYKLEKSLEILSNFIEIKESRHCAMYQCTSAGLYNDLYLNGVPLITYKLQELRESKINRFVFTTRNFGLNSYLKVDSNIDMKMGSIKFIQFEYLRTSS